MIKTTIIKASLVQGELQNEILWLSNLKPPERLKTDIDALIEKRRVTLKQIENSIEVTSIDVPIEAEKYLPKEEKPPGEEPPIIKDPVEPISKG